eukprot:SAG22_NODE_3806_length_1524_cov_2.197895_1_plen_87_part_00
MHERRLSLTPAICATMSAEDDVAVAEASTQLLSELEASAQIGALAADYFVLRAATSQARKIIIHVMMYSPHPARSCKLHGCCFRAR